MLTAIYVGNDTVIEIEGLTDERTAAYVNDATASAQLYDTDLVAVGSPVTLSYVAASNGNYQGVLESSVSLTLGAKYWIYITASSSGRNGEWRETAEVKRRRASGVQ